jgi:putative sporulation protein YtaF
MVVQYLSLILLAFAVSLDSFNVGFTYGLRKMTIPFKSIVIIACCSALSLIIAMGTGKMISVLLSPHLAEQLGGVILVILGGWVLYQFFQPERKTDQKKEKMLVKFEIKSLGVVIQILKKPMTADFDRSGTITGIEAVMLGLALSLDAFGAGIGAALLGYSPYLMALFVACMSSLFVTFGIKLGKWLAHFIWIEKISCLPGILLIVLGIWKL